MAKEVDTRIVEAQFDSRDFDKNIRQSQKTLDDFKKALDFEDAAKQMQEVTEQGGPMGEMFDKLAANVQKLANEFTGIGSISTFVAQKIKAAWQDAANSVERFIKSLTTAQIQEGNKKYEGLLRSVQTIKNATGDTEAEVYSVMEELNHYTDETSYNFSDMANNIGKFTTAGVKLRDAEKEMEGIANWAALAGQGVNEAQRAMYNISQAMSAGSMRLMDYRSIQNANMDIRQFREEALKAAVAVGALTEKNGKYYAKKKSDAKDTSTKNGKTKKSSDPNAGMVEVTLDNFTETLQYGWFNRETMEHVFKVFSDNTQGIGETAYKAAQRCVTLTDALNAIKDMLSTGWMKTYESIFGKLSDAMALFSGLCNKASEMLSKFVETRNKILERWSLTGRNSLWGALVGEIESPDGETLFKGAYGLLDALSDIGDSILDAFWGFVRRFVNPLDQELFDTDETYRFNFLAAGITNITKSIQDFTNSINHYLNDVPVGATQSRMDQIRNTIEGVFATISLVVHVIMQIAKFGGTILGYLQPSFDAIGYLIGYLAQLLSGDTAKEMKENKFGAFLQNLATILKPVADVINFITKALAGLIAQIATTGSQTGATWAIIAAIPFVKMIANLTLFHKKTSLIGKVLGAVSFLGVAKEIWTFVKSTDAFKKISAKDGPFGKFIQTIQTAFSAKNLKFIKETFNKKLAYIFGGFPKAIEYLKEKLKGFGNGILEVLNWLFTTFIDPLITPAKAESASKGLTDNITRTLIPGGDNPAAAGKSLLQRIKDGFNSFFGPIKDWFSNFFNKTIPDLMNSDGMKVVKDFFSGTTFMGALQSFVQLKKWGSVGKIGTGIFSFGKGLKSFGKGWKSLAKNLKNLNLSGVFKDMFNISNVINSNNSDQSKRTSIELGKFGSQLLQIAAAVGILVIAAVKLSSMKTTELENAGIALAALLGGLLIAGVVAKYLTGGGTGLLAMALSVMVLVGIMKTLCKPAYKGVFEEAGPKLVALMLSLAAAMWIATGLIFGKGTRKLKGAISFAIAIGLLLIPMKILAKDKVLMDGFWPLVILMEAVAVAAGIMGATKFGGFKGMIRFALAMTILLIPIKVLSHLSLDEAIMGIGGLAVLFIGIGALAAVTNEKKIAKLSGMVAAVAALALVAWLIGKTMSWKQALTGFGPILLLIADMAWFIKEAGKLNVDQIKAVKSIFNSMVAMIIAIGAAIILIDVFEVDLVTMITFFGGIILTIGLVAHLARSAKDVDAKALGSVALTLGILALVIAASAAALILIKKMDVDWPLILSFFIGLSIAIAVIAFAIKKLEDVKFLNALKGIGIIALGLAAFYAVTILASHIFLGTIGKSLRDLSANIKIMSGLLIDFFKDMNEISDESAQHAIDVMQKIKELLKSVTGISSHESDVMSLATQLLYISTGLDFLFLNDDRYPSADSSNGIALLIKMIELQPQLANLSFGDAPFELMYLGSGLNLFNTSTSGITNTNPPALALLTAISDIGENGLTIPGVADALKLEYLGSGLSQFNTLTSGIANSESPAVGLLLAVSNAGKEGLTIPGAVDALKLQYLGSGLSQFATLTSSITSSTSPAIELLGAIATAMSSDLSKWDTTVPLKLFYLGSGVGLFHDLTKDITSSETPVTGLIQNLFGQANNISTFVRLPLTDFSSKLSTLGGAMSLYAAGAKKATGVDPGDIPNITGAVEILKAICSSIAGEVGNGALIIPDNMPSEGELGLFAAELAALAEALSAYANAANEFKGDNASKSIELLKLLGEIGGYLTPKNLKATSAFDEAGVSADGANGTTSLAIFALDVKGLGGALAEFATLTSNTTFDGSLGALEKLSTINGLVTADSMAFLTVFKDSGLSGNGSEGTGTPLGMFALDITALGGALNKFSMLTANTTFDGALGALDHFSDINSKVTASALGFVNVFKDSGLSGNGSEGTGTPLGMFALDITALGGALNKFSMLTANTTFDNGFGALDYFSDINGKINADALKFVSVFKESKLTGDGKTTGTPLGKFALDIGALALALNSFSTLTTNTTFDNGFGALDKFKDLNDKLKPANLVFINAFVRSGLSGDGSETSPIGQFATDIGALGKALGTFASSVTLKDGTPADFNNALRALTFLVVLKDRMPDPSGLLSFFTGKGEQFKSLAGQLELLGQGLHDFSDKVTGVGDGNSGMNIEAVNAALDVIRNLIELMNGLMLAVQNENGYWNIGDSINNLNNFLVMLTEEQMFIRADGSKWNGSRWITMAEDIATMAHDISVAFEKTGSINTDAVEAFRNIIEGLASLASVDPSITLEPTGELITAGLAQGIKKGESKVVQAIIDVVNAGITAGNETAGIASPSKVFAEMGEYMDLGLERGLQSNSDHVENAASGLVNTALDQAVMLLQVISQAMEDGVDFQPAITPILDLSQVTQGASTIDSLFSSPTLDASGALSKANAATASTGAVEVIVQNQPDLNAISESVIALQTQLEALGTAISNMQLVLNTGVVAGGVTDDIDINLGRKTLYASRRN